MKIISQTFAANAAPLRKPQGFILITVMMFLFMLTVMALTVLRTNVLEERMAGNGRDWSLAFQAAEAALRDGEKDIQSGTRFVGEAGFVAACTNGLCTPQTDGTSIWNDMVTGANGGWMSGTDTTPSVKYGTYTSPSPATVVGVVKQPRYLIEVITEKGSSLVQGSGYGSKPNQYVYRITSRGFGASVDSSGAPVARVTLQSMYKP